MQVLLQAVPQPQPAREGHWVLAFSSGLSPVSKQRFGWSLGFTQASSPDVVNCKRFRDSDTAQLLVTHPVCEQVDFY